MNRDQKRAQVAQFKDLFQKNNFAFVIDYKGVPADVLFRMRHELKRYGSVKFVKNSLAKIASKETEGFSALADSFKEVCILVTSNDVIESVKCVLPFIKEHKQAISLKAGILDKKLLKQADLIALGKTPSREQSLANIMYLLKQPMYRLHHMVNEAAKTK